MCWLLDFSGVIIFDDTYFLGELDAIDVYSFSGVTLGLIAFLGVAITLEDVIFTSSSILCDSL